MQKRVQNYKGGGQVKATTPSEVATVPGNSPKNDKIRADLSQNEVVIPRSISSNPIAAAAYAAQQARSMQRAPNVLPLSNPAESNILLDSYASGQLPGKMQFAGPHFIEIQSDKGLQRFDKRQIDPAVLDSLTRAFGSPASGPEPQGYNKGGPVKGTQAPAPAPTPIPKEGTPERDLATVADTLQAISAKTRQGVDTQYGDKYGGYYRGGMVQHFADGGVAVPVPTPAPAAQIPAAPPQSVDSLPALLTAIGGLGLNLAGLVTRTGGVGNNALQESQQIQNKANEEANKSYNRTVADTKRTEDRNVSTQFKSRLGEIRNPNARALIGSAFSNDKLSDGQTLFYHELALQHQQDADARTNTRLDKSDDAAIGQALGNYTKERTDAAKRTMSEMPPEVVKAQNDERFFASQATPFADPESLKLAYNARKDVKSKLNDKDAAALYNQYSTFLNDKRAPVGGTGALANFLGKTLGFGAAPAPGQAFSDYTTKTVPADKLAAAQDKVSELQEHRDAVTQANDIRRRLLNPLTRGKARQEAEMFLSGAVPASTPSAAPASVGASKPAQVPQADWDALSPAGKAAAAAHFGKVGKR